ncbi:MAG: hypothetical protein ACOYEF_03835 [Planifilum sp.]|jgi:hypothetical protein
MSLKWKNERENHDNDFLDMVVSTAGSFIFFMGIAVVATVISLVW